MECIGIWRDTGKHSDWHVDGLLDDVCLCLVVSTCGSFAFRFCGCVLVSTSEASQSVYPDGNAPFIVYKGSGGTHMRFIATQNKYSIKITCASLRIATRASHTIQDMWKPTATCWNLIAHLVVWQGCLRETAWHNRTPPYLSLVHSLSIFFSSTIARSYNPLWNMYAPA